MSSSRLTVAGFSGFGGALLAVRPPLPRQPFALALLDPMGRDLVQDQRSERAIERLEDLAVAIRAALVQLRVVAAGRSPRTLGT